MKMLPRQTLPASEPLRRRHTPLRAGYKTYRSCLRWEFGFSCAFCLLHESDLVEAGAEGTALMTIEHHVTRQADPTLVDSYENCFYACRYCNRARGIVRLSRSGPRLLEPCTVAWAGHFEIVGDELRPRDGDPDAAHTHQVYGMDDPRKVAYREARRRRLDDALRAVHEIPEHVDRLLRIEEDRPHILQVAERLRRALDDARATLAHYRAIPSDHDDKCRCSSAHELPAFLAEQI